jgi:hypothetical protein
MEFAHHPVVMQIRLVSRKENRRISLRKFEKHMEYCPNSEKKRQHYNRGQYLEDIEGTDGQ